MSNYPQAWPEPQIDLATFIAANATVLGDVKLALGANIWYGAVLRGDVERIEIGENTNIQDGAILHGDPGQPTVLEDHVTVGHRAVIHGAWVERGSLIGIGAVVLNGVRIGTGSIVGAGAVVTQDIPPGSLVLGVPGKVVKTLTAEAQAELIVHAQKYVALAQTHARMYPRFVPTVATLSSEG